MNNNNNNRNLIPKAPAFSSTAAMIKMYEDVIKGEAELNKIENEKEILDIIRQADEAPGTTLKGL